ncbi:hypothetical protein [Candidatus Nitrosocosmicus franklandus]|uniref:Stress response protein YsnF n=1 Tax=Candidatus Nitrosocosmicus franklandianus TaxID=1798806 RepID=A0A484ICU3_9ARCH
MISDIDWNDAINKEARGLFDADFGEVQDISNGNVIVERGIVEKEKFCIPQGKVESFDGYVVRFNVSEQEAENKYYDDPATSIEDTF